MHKRLRTAITVFFVTLFFVTTPLVLLYTAGYRFNWKRQRVQKTGIIQVETAPKGATVSIDGRVQKRATPASFTRLLPEDYDVRVEKDGYLPWHKSLEVKSSQTTFATGIVLYADVLPRIAAEANVTGSAWNADGTAVAYVSENDNSKEISIRASGKSPVLLARFAKTAIADESLSWSPDGKKLLLSATAGAVSRVLVFETDVNVTPLSISDRLAKGTVVAHWSSEGAVVAVDSTGAYEINATAGTVKPLLTSAGVIDVESLGRTTSVLRRKKSKTGDVTVSLERVSNGAPSAVLELPDGRYHFAEGDGARALVSDDKKGRIIVVDRSSGATSTLDATGTAWEPQGDRLLLWNSYEISIYDPKTDGRELVTRLGSTIYQAAWSPAEDGIIYSQPSGISFVELDGRDYRNVYELVRYSSGGTFAVDRSSKLLRFVGGIGNQHGVYERDL